MHLDKTLLIENWRFYGKNVFLNLLECSDDSVSWTIFWKI